MELINGERIALVSRFNDVMNRNLTNVVLLSGQLRHATIQHRPLHPPDQRRGRRNRVQTAHLAAVAKFAVGINLNVAQLTGVS